MWIQQEFARLLDLYDNSFRNIAEGEVVKGTVLKVTDTEIVVDVGYKSEGIIPVDEFLDETGQVTVQPGDVVDVLLERTEDREGHIVLSREKAEKMKIWDEVERAFAERKVVIGRVIERIKGGLAVDIGVRAFLPGSQNRRAPGAQPRRAARGRSSACASSRSTRSAATSCSRARCSSKRRTPRRRSTTLETLAEGKVLRGVVKNITDYGAFIDLGGIDGLLHITDMSWGRVGHPSELFKVNDEIDVMVLKYDPATERVSLGHKQLVQDPWTTAMDRYPGRRAHERQGRQPHRLRRVHRARAGRRRPHPRQRDVVEQARQAPVEDPQRRRQRRSDGARRRSRRRGASRSASSRSRATPGTSWWRSTRSARSIKGKVRNLTEFGAFVEVEEDIDGLIHISDMSWSKRIKHPSEVLKKGDTVEAMVLSIDAENQRLSLGLKQLATDIWEDFFSRHKVGDTIEGKVVRMTNFGAFVELDEGIEGLIHVSEFDDAQGGEKINLEVGAT